MTTTSAPATPEVNYRKDYAPTPFLIDTIDLEFFLEDENTLVRATLAVRRNPLSKEAGADLVLDGEELKHVSAAIDGKMLSTDQYTVGKTELTISAPGESFTLVTEVRINPRGNSALSGLYKTSTNYCTQCEAEGFRRITWYMDRPDVMAKFTTYVEGDKVANPVMLSNGNLVGSGDLEGGKHWTRWEDPFMKPSYLFALVAGQLSCHADSFTTRSGRDVKLEIYVEAQNIEKCEHAMDSLKKSMKWDEEIFGLEYDLDQFMIVAVDDFNMGAMENKGLNVFNSSCVLANPETATDANYLSIEAIVAHEYFHNWTGNRVTCRDWFQLTLKEGLTVFRDQQFSSDMNSAAIERIGNVRGLRGRQFAEDAGPMAHPIRPESYMEMNNFYTSTVYEKGAEVIRMYHTLVGDAGFRKGMDLYFERHDGQAVTCNDFRAAISDANDIDLSQFELWYLQGGTPTLKVTSSYDATAGSFSLTLAQSCPATPDMATKKPFHVPVAVGLLGQDGSALAIQLEGEPQACGTTRVLELREAEQTFTFIGLSAEPIASVLRNFSAPMVVDYDRPESDYAFLMAHDEDAFNRWDAGQQYATTLLLDGIAKFEAGESWELPAAFVAAFEKTLDDTALDLSLKAQALSLPGEGWLADRMKVSDPVVVHKVREAARTQLAKALQGKMKACFEANQTPGAYEFSGEAVGRRGMANICMAYLTMLGEAETTALAVGRYGSANNMTDWIAALSCLAGIEGAARETALASFYDKWKGEPLVLNKWFTVQAVCGLADVTARVAKLLKHPDFTFKNPNRARSLIGAYATGNPAAFHAADGSGYRLIAQCVIMMDEINPQIASRLIDPLLGWRRLDENRQVLLKTELKKIMDVDKLSKDVFEKVSKSLA
ncbi:MAG: aminopeptidase N [Planctomycetota bacterium]|jgi:aminopeptidase N